MCELPSRAVPRKHRPIIVLGVPGRVLLRHRRHLFFKLPVWDLLLDRTIVLFELPDGKLPGQHRVVFVHSMYRRVVSCQRLYCVRELPAGDLLL